MSESGIAASAEMKSSLTALYTEARNCMRDSCPLTEPCGGNECLALARMKELLPYGGRWRQAKAVLLTVRTQLFELAGRQLVWDGTMLEPETLLLRRFVLGIPDCVFAHEDTREKFETLEVATIQPGGRWRRGYVRRSVIEPTTAQILPIRKRFFRGLDSFLNRAG